MNKRTDRLTTISCRNARKLFSATGHESAEEERNLYVERHIETCERCARDYRIFALTRTLLRQSGVAESVAPGEDFFVALRARLERGPESQQVKKEIFMSRQPTTSAVDPWASMLTAAARQLIPAMAMFLILIIGATLLWKAAPPNTNDIATRPTVRPSERVIFSDVYDLGRPPTTDDVLETLVAVEERTNGR